ASFQAGQGEVPRVWPYLGDLVATARVPAPDKTGIGFKSLARCQLHRIELRPHSGLRVAKRGHAAFGRHSGAGEHHAGARVLDQLARPRKSFRSHLLCSGAWESEGGRGVSNGQIPAATDTFKLSTSPCIGMCASQSQRSRVRRRRPVPSAPRAHASGPRRSRVNIVFPASLAAPAIQTPASLISSIARARLVTAMSGKVSAAPAAALLATSVNDAERSRGTIT